MDCQPLGDEVRRPDSSEGAVQQHQRNAANVSRQGLRFVVVGIANTAIDFFVLAVLTALTVPLVPANMASTSAGLIFSFAVNRRFTFGFTGAKPLWRQVVEFVVVTLVGLWAIQPPIIVVVRDFLLGHVGVPATAGVLIGKLIATGVTLVWNFVLYRSVVFREKSVSAERPIAPTSAKEGDGDDQ